MSKINDAIFYKFCPDVPWKNVDNKLQQSISIELWDKIMHNRYVNVLLPGMLPEILLLPAIKSILKTKEIFINKWIVPAYYKNYLRLFDINIHTKTDELDVFSEFYRLYKAVSSYPTPFFTDREGNAYFNLLYNYGEVLDIYGEPLDRNTDAFYKQLINNLCLDYKFNDSVKFINKDMAKNISSAFLRKYGINADRPYIFIDNSYVSYESADKRDIVTQPMPEYKARTIASMVSNNKYNCLVSSHGNGSGYYINNMHMLPPWYEIDCLDLLSLLYCSSGIYASDYNIAMASAIIGCNKIFCACDMDVGFDFNSAAEISLSEHKKWICMSEFEVKDVLKIFFG